MNLTAKDIAARLANDAENVCRRLLPAGRRESGNWCVGSLDGEKGQSLRVQLTGAKAGIWADFAGNDAGDLLDLWAATRQVTLREAFKEAKEWLGLADPVATNPPKQYRRPNKAELAKTIIRLKDAPPESPAAAVERYLTTERGISPKTLTAYRLGARKVAEGIQVAFPSYDASGALLGVKYIGLERTPDGKKRITQEPGCAPSLFGWQAFDDSCNTKRIIITEGQIDAMTWAQWTDFSIPCLSVPNGTGDTENWIDYEWDNLAHLDAIYLSFDSDNAGQEAIQKVARRLGVHRCFIVKVAGKDANECLLKGNTGEEAARWLMEAKPMAPKEIREPIEFRERILARNSVSDGDKKPGLEIPILGTRFRFLPGEVTLWTGYSTHGKSSFLSQVALYAALENQGVAIGSFEMRGDLTCEKLAKCLAFESQLPVKVLDECLRWMGGRIWIYDIFGIITRAKLFELMLYSACRHGVKHIILDSLMKCDVSSEDYEAQRTFMNQFIAFCHEHDVHGHIVAHPRKTDDDTKAPDIMDVHGGQAVSGQPDNIISVWRNLKKGDAQEKKKNGNGGENDGYVCIRKDRAFGCRMHIPIWYTKARERFTHTVENGEPVYQNFGIIKPEQSDLL